MAQNSPNQSLRLAFRNSPTRRTTRGLSITSGPTAVNRNLPVRGVSKISAAPMLTNNIDHLYRAVLWLALSAYDILRLSETPRRQSQRRLTAGAARDAAASSPAIRMKSSLMSPTVTRMCACVLPLVAKGLPAAAAIPRLAR